MKVKIEYLLLALMLAAFLSACAPGQKVVQPTKSPLQKLQEQAEKAWVNQDYARAETLYSRLWDSGKLGEGEKVVVLQRIAFSAARNKHANKARNYLSKWCAHDAQALKSWLWHRTMALIIKQKKGETASSNYLSDLGYNTWLPFDLRFHALDQLVPEYLQNNQYKYAWWLLASMYNSAPGQKQRLRLEEYLLSALQKLPAPKQDQAYNSIAREKLHNFPNFFLAWEHTLLQLQEEEISWQNAWGKLVEIIEQAGLMSKERFQNKFRGLVEKYGQPKLGIALLLPLSGNYRHIGWRIARGADVAQWQLSSLGIEVQVEIINSAFEKWFKELAELPRNYVLVGGPLRENIWQKIAQSEEISKRVFFVFRSSITQGQEGRDAYRFFPSAQDQVQPLANVLRGELQIEQYAILYHKSDYGRKMAQAFWKEMASRNAKLTNLDAYSSKPRLGWKHKIAAFLNLPENWRELEKEEKPDQKLEPDPDFQAVFIPDSFKRARLIIPEFFYFDQDQLLFLGTSLWSQEMNDISQLDLDFYRLTLFTGPWWNNNPSKAAEKLREGLHMTAQGEPDFWVALGYDFLRFAGKFKQISPHWKAEEVNKYLNTELDFDWSIAPLKWNAQGQASQELYLFQPGKDEAVRADPARVRSRLKKIGK